MNLVYRHNKDIPDYGAPERSTIAMEKPHVLELLQEMRKQYTKSILSVPKVTVNIGSTRVHPKDPYNKKIGRKLAESRMKAVEMVIEPGEYQHDDSFWLELRGVDKDTQTHYTISLKIYRDSGLMRVMGIYSRKWT